MPHFGVPHSHAYRSLGRAPDAEEPARITREIGRLEAGALRSHPTMLPAGSMLLGLFLAPALPAAQQPETAASIAFTEGPAADREGNVYFSDLLSHRIYHLRPDGALVIYRERSNGANGLLIDGAGRLVACES